MLGILLLLFIALPIIELILLLRIGAWLGGWTAVALVLATGVIGAMLARSQGARVLLEIRAELGAGRLPVARLVDGAMILAAGLLLITPGILSDTFGILLLFPPSRSLVRRWVSGRMRRMVETGRAQVTIIHGDAVRPDPAAPPDRRPTQGRDVTDL